MRRIALTGGIATGKSHIRARFEQLGVPTIDSDILACEAVAPGTAGLAAVIEEFGPDVLQADGSLDRRKLADIVFADPAARKSLEAIIHPEVRRAIDVWFAALDAQKHPFAISDIPLLYEVGRERDFEAVIVAACDPETQVRRVMKRNGISEADARRRIGAQLLIEEKSRRADYVIRTDGSFEDTDRQIRDTYAGFAGSR